MTVKKEIIDGVALLTIDRPPVNAINIQLLEELSRAFDELKKDEHVGVVILTGAGNKAFVAGADMNELSKMDTAGSSNFLCNIQETFNEIEDFPKPVICAINSTTIGNGCELAMVCDIRLAGEKATFLFPECDLGLVSAGGATQRLPRLVPKGKALFYFFTAKSFSSREAERIGFVDFVFKDEELLNEAKKMAKQILKNAPTTLKLVKKAVNDGLKKTLSEGLEIEMEMSRKGFFTEDRLEGMTAFLEKRPAYFRKNY